MAVFTTSAKIKRWYKSAVIYGSDADEEFDKKVGNNRIKSNSFGIKVNCSYI